MLAEDVLKGLGDFTHGPIGLHAFNDGRQQIIGPFRLLSDSGQRGGHPVVVPGLTQLF